MLVDGRPAGPDLRLHIEPRVRGAGPVQLRAQDAVQARVIHLAAEKRAADPKLSEEDATAAVFAEWPELYDVYRAVQVTTGATFNPSQG